MKNALVTGSTKGIGLALSQKLIERGYYVYMNYSKDDKAASSLDIDSNKHSVIKADVSTLDGVNALLEFLLKENINLDCLVLNVGITCRKPFGQIEYSDWSRVIDANVNMPFFIVQGLRNIISDFGSIIFTGSDMGIYPHSVSISYGVSKAAIHMLARSLVKEFAGRKIRINAIAPGFIDTQWQEEKPEWLREKIEKKIALKRFGTPQEVAEACVSLLDNKYINGTVLTVDGGYNFE
jgi:3-oxoacyl-[acyl-carrier protein] reductase